MLGPVVVLPQHLLCDAIVAGDMNGGGYPPPPFR